MRFFAALIIFALAICGLPSRAATINGQNYVSLTSWAKSNNYRVASNSKDLIVLTNKTSRLAFDIDSAEVEINGVNVRLSFPVAKGPLIAQFDLNTAVIPLLTPANYSGYNKITTICIDPGHGGKDTGNRVFSGISWRNEKTYTLLLAQELQKELKALGFNVILTRNKDTYVDLPSRPAIANKAGADLFISLHFNATSSSKETVQGIETYCITPVGAASSNSQGEGSNHSAVTGNTYERRSLLLAYQMQKSLTKNLPATDRDVRRARFAVLRDAKMPAILIEGGYMTNPSEGKKIYDANYRKQMAASIVRGIQAYQKLTTPAAAPAKTTSPTPTKSK